MDPWKAMREQFPVADELAYLNHAAVAPLPRPCQSGMEDYLAELSRYGAAHYPAGPFAMLARARRLGGRLMGAEPDDVFIVRSTTQGIGVAATGIPYRDGDNVVIVEGEFPANVRPWRALRKRGVEVRTVPQRDGRVELDDLAAATDDHTAALAISFVQFVSGFRVDLAAVAEIARRHDALFVVDAIQGLGVMPLHVERMGIDFLSADSHKWMLGPEGVGVGYASPRARGRIEQVLEGWMGLARPFDFADPDQPLRATAARYEEGAYNFAGIHGMVGSLELLLGLGVDAISRRLLDLTDELSDALVSRGWQLLSPRAHDGEKSGILTATHPNATFDGMTERVLSRGVFISVRGGALRVSPHAYNDQRDLDALLAAIDDEVER